MAAAGPVRPTTARSRPGQRGSPRFPAPAGGAAGAGARPVIALPLTVVEPPLSRRERPVGTGVRTLSGNGTGERCGPRRARPAGAFRRGAGAQALRVAGTCAVGGPVRGPATAHVGAAVRHGRPSGGAVAPLFPRRRAAATDLVAVDVSRHRRGRTAHPHALAADLARSWGGGRPWLLMEQARRPRRRPPQGARRGRRHSPVRPRPAARGPREAGRCSSGGGSRRAARSSGIRRCCRTRRPTPRSSPRCAIWAAWPASATPRWSRTRPRCGTRSAGGRCGRPPRPPPTGPPGRGPPGPPGAAPPTARTGVRPFLERVPRGGRRRRGGLPRGRGPGPGMVRLLRPGRRRPRGGAVLLPPGRAHHLSPRRRGGAPPFPREEDWGSCSATTADRCPGAASACPRTAVTCSPAPRSRSWRCPPGHRRAPGAVSAVTRRGGHGRHVLPRRPRGGDAAVGGWGGPALTAAEAAGRPRLGGGPWSPRPLLPREERRAGPRRGAPEGRVRPGRPCAASAAALAAAADAPPCPGGGPGIREGPRTVRPAASGDCRGGHRPQEGDRDR